MTATTSTVPATTRQPTSTTSSGSGGGEGQAPPRSQRKPHGPAESGAADPRVTAAEREAAATVRRYVAALDDRDGGAGVRPARPGAAGELDPPVPRGGLCASIGASIGYRDPRGLPVWQPAEVDANPLGRGRRGHREGGRHHGDHGSPTATSGSVEDDIVYLVRAGDHWLVAKPSSTLYRSIGVADVPPSVLAPPR